MTKRSPAKQNNKSFKESFDHVEPWVDWAASFNEAFNHTDPPSMSLDFTETFDA